MRTGFWNEIENFGSRIALITEQQAISYQTLAALADAIADRMDKRALAFLICKNQVPSIAGYLGCLRRGVVPVLLHDSIDKEQYEKLLQRYKPRYIWCPDDFTDTPDTYRCRGYKLISADMQSPEMHQGLALLVTTSGTTGSPKLVRLSYGNLQFNTCAIAEYLQIAPEDKVITTLPMSYVYGLSMIQSHLAVGAAVILTEKKFFERSFWDCFKKHGATTFGTVPYIYQMLDKLSFLKADLPTLRYLTQAGGKLGKTLHEKIGSEMLTKGKKFIVMYGASEATARMSYVPGEMAVQKAGSIGVAIPGGRFELIQPDGTVIEESDCIGELVYYGPNVMQGYAQCRADLAKGDELHGRLATGDLAMRDGDGYYYIVGRKSRFLKVYGNRVNLGEIEEILGEKGYEAACTGEDDRIRIYTTSRAAEDMIALLCRKTGLDKAAFTVISVDAIPRNPAGKILYSELN